jgi:hypothetical protein
MLGIGIVLAAVGYTIVFYGAELWAGQAVSIGSASGFQPPPSAAASAGSPRTATGLGQALLATSPLLFFLSGSASHDASNAFDRIKGLL